MAIIGTRAQVFRSGNCHLRCDSADDSEFRCILSATDRRTGGRAQRGISRTSLLHIAESHSAACSIQDRSRYTGKYGIDSRRPGRLTVVYAGWLRLVTAVAMYSRQQADIQLKIQSSRHVTHLVSRLCQAGACDVRVPCIYAPSVTTMF